MKRQLVSVFAAALGAALLLGGCSNAAGIKALDRAATVEDTLPGGVSAESDVAPDATRLLATHDSVKYFVGMKEAGGACLFVVPEADPGLGSAGCTDSPTTGGEILRVGGPASPTTLVTDGFDSKKLESEGWTRIHDNLLVKAK
ncbi:hypothetical protein [Arthrobacter celericrescens]|uniref:hypothetical protein n=1 Tax=Arthrobacter celericrescens TaxID=2320851 RepID=UPI0013C4310C|nr:hypothetical protein [Arthrobacter celericrescens]